VDPRHLESLLPCQERQDSRQAPRQHGLPRSRRTGEEEVVRPRRGDLEGPPGPFLAPHVAEIRDRVRLERIG
jgi:hypothetical protein